MKWYLPCFRVLSLQPKIKTIQEIQTSSSSSSSGEGNGPSFALFSARLGPTMWCLGFALDLPRLCSAVRTPSVALDPVLERML